MFSVMVNKVGRYACSLMCILVCDWTARSKAGGVSPQQHWVHHTPLQGQVQGEVIGRSLHAMARESPAPVRNGQLRVVGRQRSREEVGVEQRLQGAAQR